MAISDDWDVDFVNKVISHVDGVLAYDGVTPGDPPQAGDYIRGGTSGATGKIIGTIGQDISDSTDGTVSLTNVRGQFQDNDALTVLDALGFDGVTNGGFQVGDTIQENGGGAEIVVDAIEYHYYDTTITESAPLVVSTSGSGTIFGRHNATAFTNNDNLEKTTAAGTTVAVATGAVTDGDAWTGADVTEPSVETISPPGSDVSVIVNFDGGTEAIPRFSTIQNTNDASPGKTGVVQQIYGITITGSLRLVDTATAWTDDAPIYVKKVPYDGLVAGETFKVGDKIVTKSTTGGTVSGSGKIIVADTANSKIVLQNQSGTFTDGHFIFVRTTSDTKVATINAATDPEFQDKHADVNGDEIKEQLASQGGVYSTSESLNIVRDSNALYTYLQDTFDELGALDDDVPMTAQVALQQFTLVNGWKIPDLSFRFLESGSIQDTSLDNIWTNYQTLGTVEGIGNEVYAATTPQPQFYIEQDGSVIDTFWLAGHIDVLVKVKTNTDTTKATDVTGVLINSGTVTIFNRNFGDTYDHFETTTVAGVAPVPLATSADLNNTSGTHQLSYDGQTGNFTSGEEIRTSDAGKRGIVTSLSETGAATEGTIDYILLTPATNFSDNDAISGEVSESTANVTGAPSTLVAGYGTKIVIATVEGTIPYASGTTATDFFPGEVVTSSGGGSAIMMNDSGIGAATGTLTLGNMTEGTPIGNTETLTGDTSGATAVTNSTFTATTVINRDIADGNGNQEYNAVIYLDRDEGDGTGDTLARMYEWVKYRTRSLESTGEPAYNLLGGKGSESGVQGRLYITLDSDYALVKASPLGTFAGGTFFGARGVFIQDMAAADIRNYQLIDAAGTVRNPPDLQTLEVNSVVSGDRVAVFRTTDGSIQTTEFAVSTAVNTTVNSGAASIIEVHSTEGDRMSGASSLPQDVPASAVVRVLDPTDTGLYLSFPYSEVSRSNRQFTLTSGAISDTTGSGNDLTTHDNAFVVLIEEEATGTSVSNSIIFVSNIPILTRVRVKGILPFEVSGTFGSGGASVAAIRTFDSIVD